MNATDSRAAAAGVLLELTSASDTGRSSRAQGVSGRLRTFICGGRVVGGW